MWTLIHRFFGNERGAIAPTVALSLIGLVAASGIAFDFARLAAMDTELQQAADHAALAAATQLDRSSGARARATAAIQNPGTNRLASNLTRFAKADATSGMSVEIASITFCKAFDDTKPDATACTAATADNDSAFVMVTTQVRTARYAFTPIVGLFQSSITASAVAGVQSSICNVAPLLVCAPNDDFPTDADIGKGVILKTAGGDAWAPGNYGYLDFGNGNPAVLAALLGNGLDGCQNQDDNQTEPGNKNATDAINTRMDVYAGANKNDASKCVPSTGVACPSQNTRKDMTLEMTYVIEQPAADPAPLPSSVPNCGAAATGTGNPNPSISYASDFAQNGNARQFGRDTCHYTGTCPTTGGAQNFGDGTWDRAGYIAANHPGETASTIAAAIGGGATAATLSRYHVYLWEIANMGSGKLNPVQVGTMAPADVQTKGNKTTYTFKRQCAFNQPRFAPAASDTAKDRRVLPIVAANCSNLKGKGQAFEDYIILRVFNIFLTEPSLQRSATQTGITGATTDPATDDKEIYGEIIGPGETFGAGGGFQYYARNKPYLVR